MRASGISGPSDNGDFLQSTTFAAASEICHKQEEKKRILKKELILCHVLTPLDLSPLICILHRQDKYKQQREFPATFPGR